MDEKISSIITETSIAIFKRDTNTLFPAMIEPVFDDGRLEWERYKSIYKEICAHTDVSFLVRYLAWKMDKETAVKFTHRAVFIAANLAGVEPGGLFYPEKETVVDDTKDKTRATISACHIVNAFDEIEHEENAKKRFTIMIQMINDFYTLSWQVNTDEDEDKDLLFENVLEELLISAEVCLGWRENPKGWISPYFRKNTTTGKAGAPKGNQNAAKDGVQRTIRIRFDNEEQADFANTLTPEERGKVLIDAAREKQIERLAEEYKKNSNYKNL